MNTEPDFTNTYLAKTGGTYFFEYFQTDSFSHLPHSECAQVYGICFLKGKIIIVNNVDHPGSYVPVGGSVEEGDEDTFKLSSNSSCVASLSSSLLTGSLVTSSQILCV